MINHAELTKLTAVISDKLSQIAREENIKLRDKLGKILNELATLVNEESDWDGVKIENKVAEFLVLYGQRKSIVKTDSLLADNMAREILSIKYSANS